MKENILNHGINILKSILLLLLVPDTVLIVTLLLTFTPLKEDTIPLVNYSYYDFMYSCGSIYVAIKSWGKRLA